ncbi:MAG: ATP-binding protein [Prevotella sp.]|nr:ATP-binding protein [Prevotella sp.]MBR3110131.1 ATP-binding protein [Prevotella sp.]MBR3111657.1 ATP-binding protein [Prevotella sp.]
MSELRFQPIRGKAREILKAILQTPEVSSCAMKDVMLIRLACEELVMNITSYAYPEDVEGFLEVDVEKTDERIVIRFKDGGMPFNPLEHKKPDTKLPWKLRRIGGLGIFLVKKKMDDVRYAYEDNKNVLTIEKAI